MLVTQNIDDLHNQAMMKFPKLKAKFPTPKEGSADYAHAKPMAYEIHGNVKYMHCNS